MNPSTTQQRETKSKHTPGTSSQIEYRTLTRTVLTGTPGGEAVRHTERFDVGIIWPEEAPLLASEFEPYVHRSDFALLPDDSPRRIDFLDHAEADKEAARWQDRILAHCVKMVAHLPEKYRRELDGSSCDSGDPLDVSDLEISQAFGAFFDYINDLTQPTSPGGAA